MITIEEKILEELKEIRRTLKSSLTPSAPNVSFDGGTYNPGRDFTLYVGVAGNVVGVDKDGNAVNRNFTAGYHPIIFKSITESGTTATGLGANYI